MKKKIATLCSLLIITTIAISTNHFSKPNDIDYLQSTYSSINDYISESDTIYFFSNSKSKALYFKTQFVLAPKLVVLKEFSKIRESSYILSVNDKLDLNYDSNSNSVLSNLKSIYTNENKNYKVTLLKK